MMVEAATVTIILIAASAAGMAIGFSIGRIFEIANDERIKARRMHELAYSKRRKEKDIPQR